VAAVMLRLGCTAFGGPAAHVAMLKQEVVDRRRWVSEQEFLDLFGAAGLIPGPQSTELAIHLGMTRAGVPGLWVAGLCFTSPAVLITATIAWAYTRYAALPASQALLAGLKPAVVAVIAALLVGLTKSAIKRPILGGLAALNLGLSLLGANEIALLLASGLIGLLLASPPRLRSVSPALLLPLVAGAAAAAPRPDPAAVFLYFLKIGATLFGSGYLLIAFLRQGLVLDYGWLTDAQLADAVAAGQFTPGPVFSTAAFVGYLVGGWPGAVVASAGIFLPAFLCVWATHGVVRRLRENPRAAGFLDGVNAASVGLVGGVTLQLAKAALVSPAAWVILAVSLLLALRTRLNNAWIMLAAALAGLLLGHGA
jgi:chromate transporter